MRRACGWNSLIVDSARVQVWAWRWWRAATRDSRVVVNVQNRCEAFALDQIDMSGSACPGQARGRAVPAGGARSRTAPVRLRPPGVHANPSYTPEGELCHPPDNVAWVLGFAAPYVLAGAGR